jgi:hypothetical protein
VLLFFVGHSFSFFRRSIHLYHPRLLSLFSLLLAPLASLATCLVCSSVSQV